jgi:hypothetical protein
MNIITTTLFVTLTLLLSSSCARTVKNINKNQIIDKKQGVIVTNIHSNWLETDKPFKLKLKFSFYKKGEKSQLKKFALSSPEELKIMTLSPGEYYWSEIYAGRYSLKIEGNSGFRVKAGEITYIGDIYTNITAGWIHMNGEVKIFDNSQKVEQILKKEYFNLFRRFTYSVAITNLVEKQIL